MPEELSRNQSILRFDVILQHDWPIEQCLLHIRVFFGGKTKSPCFDLFIHWLIKQITNNYRNHFSRSYENRSIPPRGVVLPVLREFENCYGKVFRSHGTTLTARNIWTPSRSKIWTLKSRSNFWPVRSKIDLSRITLQWTNTKKWGRGSGGQFHTNHCILSTRASSWCLCSLECGKGLFERQGVDTVVACMRGFSVGKREDNCKQILREWIYESCYYTLCLEILRFDSAKIVNGFV